MGAAVAAIADGFRIRPDAAETMWPRVERLAPVGANLLLRVLYQEGPRLREDDVLVDQHQENKSQNRHAREGGHLLPRRIVPIRLCPGTTRS